MKLIITLRILMLTALVGGMAYFASRRGFHLRSRPSPAPSATSAPQAQDPADGMQNRISESEYTALVDIYYITSGNGWRNKSGWLNPKAASWFGVRVADGHVTEFPRPFTQSLDRPCASQPRGPPHAPPPGPHRQPPQRSGPAPIGDLYLLRVNSCSAAM